MNPGKASKSKSQGREGWCVIFFHPCRPDDRGNPLRVRRGLGTRDDATADTMVSEINEMIADPQWHTPAARERATRRFTERAVAIFFDSMEAEMLDGWAQREAAIPLPTRDDGYCRILVVGATGAGKTTFVRQMIGTDPDRERFPSTSTSRTTVADLEAVLSSGPFRAVVTFYARDRIRGYIEECVVAAISSAAEGGDDSRVASRLLEHSEQRFRLAYVLGSLAEADPTEESWDEPSVAESAEPALISAEEGQALRATLRAYLMRCRVVGDGMREALGKILVPDGKRVTGSERDAFQELLEEEAASRGSEFFPEIQSLVDDILDDVESRFSILQGGDLDRARSGWPIRWSFESYDRGLFLRQVNRFSSNYAPHFGRLLTPLVQGIRVIGPFAPDWAAEQPRLVLLDGEGLGHTSDSATSLPTTLTRRFPDVDVIALIDTATQPMLAGPAAVIRTVTSMGHDSKLMVLFTRFDEVKGANLPTLKAKQEHVRCSLENAASGLDDVLGGTTVRGLLRNLEGKVFYLASIDRKLSLIEKPAMRLFTEEELRRFVSACSDAIKPAVPVEAHPVYDMANLVLSLASATSRFQRGWGSRLGVVGLATEHWTRVKALSRRLAEWDEDQYDTMRPVADLLRELTEGLTKFLANPREWEPANAPDELKQAALEAVRQEVSAALYEFTAARLRHSPLVDWRHAFRLSGTGSGRQRSRDIWDIYLSAAPHVSDVPTKDGVAFLDDARDLFRAAVTRAGGTVK